MATLICVAGGFRFKSTRAELEAHAKRRWWPMTVDFWATAKDTKYPGQRIYRYRCRSANQFLRRVSRFSLPGRGRRRTKSVIDRVLFIGHGAGDALGFAGRIDASGGIRFTSYLDRSRIPSARVLRKIQRRLDSKATFDIVCCGKKKVTRAFYQLIADRFAVTVRGFVTPVGWEFEQNSAGRIIRRGGLVVPTWPAAMGLLYGVDNLTFPLVLKPRTRRIP